MIQVLVTPLLTASTQHSILGIMPPEIMPCFNQERDLRDVDNGEISVDSSFLIPQQALDIGHQNQVFGAQSRRNPCRSGIGVDVVYLAIRIGGHGCDDRDK